MLAGQGKTAPVAEVVQTAPPAYNQAVQAEVVHAAPMSPPMVVTCPPGVAPGQPMRVVDPATGQTMQVTVPNGVKPGGQFQVQFPAPAPVVQAPAQGQIYRRGAAYLDEEFPLLDFMTSCEEVEGKT